MKMKKVRGNLITLTQKGKFDVVVHGANCMCTMGAGIAKEIKRIFPLAYIEDCKTKKGDRKKLGTCTFAKCLVGNKIVEIVNAYTQYDYKGNGVKLNYDALRSCMREIKEKYSGKKIGMPKIGAGLARGSWEKILPIIEEELENENVTVVELRR
jgi:O-acetyl-ADP-ribose deacetylase (regulator of RNase III)